MKKFDLITLGQIIADVVVRPVDSLPEKGLIKQLEFMDLMTGGCSCNTAIVASALGLNIGLIGKVCNDAFGSFLIQKIKEYKMDVKGIIIAKYPSTSSVIVLVGNDGERSFLYRAGATESMTNTEINLSVLRKTKFLHIGGVMKLHNLDFVPLLKNVKEYNVVITLDTDADVAECGFDYVKPVLPFIDIIMPSLEEGRKLTRKKKPQDIADFLMKNGILNRVIVKLGAEGCYSKSRNGSEIIISGYKVKPVDTTGAGDSFCAGVIAGLVKNMKIEDCLKFANAVAARRTLKIGASSDPDSYETVLQFIKESDKNIFNCN